MIKARVIEILILILILLSLIFGVKTVYYRVYVKPNLYTITFSDIDSIIKGSPVRFMGIIVGHVRELKRTEGKILCQILITKPNTKIPDGAVAKVEFNGLAGSKSIEIMPPKTEDSAVKGIITAETLRINDFMDTFENLQEVFACIKEFVYGITPESSLQVAKTVSNLEIPDDTNKLLDNITNKQRTTTRKLKNANKIENTVDSLNHYFSEKK